jgi:hypothetical protein
MIGPGSDADVVSEPGRDRPRCDSGLAHEPEWPAAGASLPLRSLPGLIQCFDHGPALRRRLRPPGLGCRRRLRLRPRIPIRGPVRAAGHDGRRLRERHSASRWPWYRAAAVYGWTSRAPASTELSAARSALSRATSAMLGHPEHAAACVCRASRPEEPSRWPSLRHAKPACRPGSEVGWPLGARIRYGAALGLVSGFMVFELPERRRQRPSGGLAWRPPPCGRRLASRR